MIAAMTGGQQCAAIICSVLFICLTIDSYFKSKYGANDKKDDK